MLHRHAIWISHLLPRPYWLRLLFVGALCAALWLGQVTVPHSRAIAQSPPTSALEPSSVAQAFSPEQAVQSGVVAYQSGDYEAAIAAWQLALQTYQAMGQTSPEALVLENLARAYQKLGRTNDELITWGQAIERYQQLGDRAKTGQMLTEQAQAYSRLGQHRQAIAVLCGLESTTTCDASSAVGIAQATSDRNGEAAALGSLGEALRQQGQYAEAQQRLEQSLAIAEALANTPYIAAAYEGLGNTQVSLALVNYQRANSARLIGDTIEAAQLEQQAQMYDGAALNYFQDSLTVAQPSADSANRLRTLIGIIQINHRLGDRVAAAAQHTEALALLNQLNDSQVKAYAAINLALVVQRTSATLPLSRRDCADEGTLSEAIALLNTALGVAQRIHDSRSESFALGELGHIYECQRQYEQALQLTQQARWAAEQDLRSKDSLYLWEWQTGRILIQQGQREEAIAAYESAISTLEVIRNDLLVANRDLQFDFRDAVDPIYRQLVKLRLEREQISPDSNSRLTPATNIDAALNTLDSLRLAELQNYFGDNCIISVVDAPQGNELIEPTTAVLSTVILNDQTAVVATFADRKQLAWINISRDTLNDTIKAFRVELERYFEPFPAEAQANAAQLYDWLIAPFEATLAEANIDTLVFVQDGLFRSIPMASLYNRKTQQFLIEQYAVAVTPSLKLTTPNPLHRSNLKALAVGVDQASEIDNRLFEALPNVNNEISLVSSVLPGSKSLLNQEFTSDRLQQELSQDDFSVIHIATHGEFGVEPENTFLVAGNNQKLTITELDRIIRNTQSGAGIELLSLTACQTAVGDDRSALGLAGVAVQAGVKSALASLWSVNDQTTAELTSQFYQMLVNQPDMSKAKALQAAQVAVLQKGGRTGRPGYWAPFILIGNWL